MQWPDVWEEAKQPTTHVNPVSYMLTKLYEWECENHLGPGSLCNKALGTSYYWSIMKMDTYKFVKQCDKC